MKYKTQKETIKANRTRLATHSPYKLKTRHNSSPNSRLRHTHHATFKLRPIPSQRQTLTARNFGQFKMGAQDNSWTSLHSHSHVPKLDQVQQEDYHGTHGTFGQFNMQAKSCKDNTPWCLRLDKLTMRLMVTLEK